MPFLQLSGDEWKRTLDINLNGAFLCRREAIRDTRPRRFGRIILFSSTLVRPAGEPWPDHSASKGGVLGRARGLALKTLLVEKYMG